MAAWQDHAEGWKGRLAPGMVADVAILDGDLLGTDPRDLEEMQFRTTIVGGEVVYERRSSIAAASATAAYNAGRGHGHGGSSRDEHALACLNDGKCCCVLSDELAAGQIV